MSATVVFRSLNLCVCRLSVSSRAPSAPGSFIIFPSSLGRKSSCLLLPETPFNPRAPVSAEISTLPGHDMSRVSVSLVVVCRFALGCNLFVRNGGRHLSILRLGFPFRFNPSPRRSHRFCLEDLDADFGKPPRRIRPELVPAPRPLARDQRHVSV